MFSAAQPAGALIGQSYLDAAISSAEQITNFSFTLNPGQKVSVAVITSDGSGLQPTILLTDPNHAPIASTTAFAPGQKAVLETVLGLVGGNYQITVGGANGTTGDFILRVTLNAAIERERYLDQPNNTRDAAEDLMGSAISVGPNGAQQLAVIGDLAGRPSQTWPDPADFYRAYFYKGQVISVVLTRPGYGATHLQIQDGVGTVLAIGWLSSASSSEVVQNFLAPYTGYYFMQVTGDPGTFYTLLVSINAAFSVPAGNSPFAGQPLAGLTGVYGNLVNPPGSVGTLFFSVNANVGDHLHFATSTTNAGPAELANNFFPELLLYDPNGNLVAIANGNAFDGRNSIIDFTVPDGDQGAWVIEVTPSPSTEVPTQGDFFLVVQGANGNPVVPLNAIATAPAAGNAVAPPTSFTIQFNQPINGGTLTPAQLTINGQPCVSVALTQPDTATWTLAPGTITAGQNITNQVSLAADPPTGQLVASLRGAASSPFTTQFITSSSLTPPATGADQIILRQDSPTNIPVALLLSNDSSPRNSPLAIISVSGSAFATATLINGNSVVAYAPPSAYTGTNQFQYTVYDGYLTSTGTVTVIILSPGAPDFNHLTFSARPAGPHLAYSGFPGKQYAFQSAATLQGPWSDLFPMFTAGLDGLIEYDVKTSSPVPAQFFRIRQLP